MSLTVSQSHSLTIAQSQLRHSYDKRLSARCKL